VPGMDELIALATYFPPRDWPGPLLAQGCILLDVRTQGQKARVSRERGAGQLAGYLLLQLEPKHRWVLYSFSASIPSPMLREEGMEALTFTDQFKAPLKDLLVTILKEDAAENCGKTLIWGPVQHPHAFGNMPFWNRSQSRLRRPLSTVILNQQQKDTVVDDITNFLSRSGVMWHKEKGLPL